MNLEPKFCSVDYYEILHIYCGPPIEWCYPPEILEMCLTFAGLIGKGPRCTFFWVYF